MKSIVTVLALLILIGLNGCTSAIGFGNDDGVGLKSSVGKDGKILMVEPTDGEGRPRE